MNQTAPRVDQGGMKTLAAALLIALAGTAAHADGTDALRIGARARVQPDSIWFENDDDLTRWQQLKRAGRTAARAAFEDTKLRARDAWQFSYPLEVKILRRGPGPHQVTVEMTTEGRFQGTIWPIDLDTIVK